MSTRNIPDVKSNEPAAVKKKKMRGEVLDKLSANEMFLYFVEITKISAR